LDVLDSRGGITGGRYGRLKVDEEPDTDTEPCLMLGFELARSLLATTEKLDSQSGTRGCLRSNAAGGFEEGFSKFGLLRFMTNVPR
jgi:hypothetical protein